MAKQVGKSGQGDKVVNLKHFLLCQKVGGSAEEVARVVAACKECDMSGAWSSKSTRGTPGQVSQLSDHEIQNCGLLYSVKCF